MNNYTILEKPKEVMYKEKCLKCNVMFENICFHCYLTDILGMEIYNPSEIKSPEKINYDYVVVKKNEE